MKRTAPIPYPDREVLLEANNLSNAEARFLVSAYYADQKRRMRADMQLRHLGDRAGDDSRLLKYVADVHASTEAAILKMLDKYSSASAIGVWMKSQIGIGPVIAAGLLAHIDIEKALYAGNVWSFAGLDPSRKWEKGTKRPYNAELKQICWHAGECFKRTSGNPKSVYGKLYKQKKIELEKRNDAGAFAERAKVFVTKSADVRKILKDGKLPQGNLDSQATRYATKIFLSHLHAVWYWHQFGKAPPRPFAIAILGHGREIRIPNMEIFDGFEQAYYGSTSTTTTTIKPTRVKVSKIKSEPGQSKVSHNTSEPKQMKVSLALE